MFEHAPKLAHHKKVVIEMLERMERKNAVDGIVSEREGLPIQVQLQIATADYIDIDEPIQGSLTAADMKLDWFCLD